MSLVACHECGKDVSTEAKVCPSCGAAVKHVAPPGVFKTLALFFAGLFGCFFVWALFNPDPDQDEKNRRRHAIKLCWEQQERKSISPADARFIAGACEVMEREFESLFGIKP